MAAEELAANQRVAMPVTDPVARDVARWASERRVTPAAMAAFSVGFGAIAAVWLTGISVRAEATACVALAFAFVVGRAGRMMAGAQPTAATDWAQGACAVLTELAVYAGIAGGASANDTITGNTGLTGPVGEQLRNTSLVGLGAPGTAGVWRLAAAAAIALALVHMADLCHPPAADQGPHARRFQALVVTPGDERLLLIGGAVLLVGARGTFVLLLVLGVLAFGAVLTRRSASRPQQLLGYRGDGPLSIWIGRFVDGRLPPLPPLLVGLLVTGMLAALGLQNLPGILVLTPVEAMLLAALASWHPHDGKLDWLAPPLLQAGEYVFIAALGVSGHVFPPVTFALLAAVALRHLELAYWAKNLLRPGADKRAQGWEGRMIVVGIAAVAGILPMIYPLLAVYLWGLLAWDWLVVWLARHPAVHGERRPRHERTVVTGQEQHAVRDLVRCGVPGQRDHPVEDRCRRRTVSAGGDDLDVVLELVVDRPRVNGVDPDAAGRELGGQRPHQSDLGVLGGRIPGDVRGGGEAHHAGGDDHARAGRQVRHRVLAQQERAAHVHRERLVESIFRVFGDRRGGAADPGVRDHDIQPPEPADRRVHGRLHLRRVRHVGHRPRGGAGAELGRARLQVRFGDARQEDPGPFRREQAGGRHADASLAAGDDRGPAVKSPHGTMLAIL